MFVVFARLSMLARDSLYVLPWSLFTPIYLGFRLSTTSCDLTDCMRPAHVSERMGTSRYTPEHDAPSFSSLTVSGTVRGDEVYVCVGSVALVQLPTDVLSLLRCDVLADENDDDGAAAGQQQLLVPRWPRPSIHILATSICGTDTILIPCQYRPL